MSETTSETKEPSAEDIEAARKLIAAFDEGKTWRDNDRVTVTPTHFEIQIYKWAESDSPERAKAEKENPPMAPPDKVRVKRAFTVSEGLKLDEYDVSGGRKVAFALACILTGVNEEFMLRMDWQDYVIVTDAVNEVYSGKG